MLEAEEEEAHKKQRQVKRFAKAVREEAARRELAQAARAKGSRGRGRWAAARGKGKPQPRMMRRGSVLSAAAAAPAVAGARRPEYAGPLEAYEQPDVRVHVADLVSIVDGALSEQREQRPFCAAGGATKARAVPDYADDFA